MSYTDRTLNCRECNAEFVFTVGEQEFYAQKGFVHDPVRCPDCRRERKRAGGDRRRGGSGGGRSHSREQVQHEVICDSCGKTTTVPFVPRGDRPVYCSDCFQKQREANVG